MEATTDIQSDEGLLDIPTGEIMEPPFESDCPEGIDPALWIQWQDEEELKKDYFLYQLKRGKEGHNVGLENGLTNINKYIYGTQKGWYYLIGGESSSGKTTIGDFMFVLNAWMSAKQQNRPIKIYYCSFEIGKTEKLFRWCSYFIYLKYGVQLPGSYLQGRITDRLIHDQHTLWALEAYTIIKEMLKDVDIVQDTIHPTKIFEDLIESHFAKHGTVKRADISAEDKKKGKKGYVKAYTENDPKLITLLVVDHLALTGTEMHLETKGIMDKMSKYMIVLRNIFHCTGIFYQQFSPDMMSTYRGAYGKKIEAILTPQRIDFGDSKATFRDADIVFGLVGPQKDIEDFKGYKVDKVIGLGDCFRALYLMKHRYGSANRMVPLFMDGITGMLYDLPLNPYDETLMDPWYAKAQQIEQLCQSFSLNKN